MSEYNEDVYADKRNVEGTRKRLNESYAKQKEKEFKEKLDRLEMMLEKFPTADEVEEMMERLLKKVAD